MLCKTLIDRILQPIDLRPVKGLIIHVRPSVDLGINQKVDWDKFQKRRHVALHSIYRIKKGLTVLDQPLLLRLRRREFARCYV